MRTVVRIIGALLTAAGAALLLYVSVSRYQAQNAANSGRWSRSEQVAGKRLAAQLARRQAVAVPRELAALQTGVQPAMRMVIPKIAVDAPVVQTPPTQGVWEVADWSVGHLSTTPNPGVPGNAAYAAHDDIKGEIFKRLGELVPGDKILLYTQHSLVTYLVTRQLTVDPSDISPLQPTARPTVTLITCSPYWVDTQRLIVQAVEKSSAAL